MVFFKEIFLRKTTYIAPVPVPEWVLGYKISLNRTSHDNSCDKFGCDKNLTKCTNSQVFTNHSIQTVSSLIFKYFCRCILVKRFLCVCKVAAFFVMSSKIARNTSPKIADVALRFLIVIKTRQI